MRLTDIQRRESHPARDRRPFGAKLEKKLLGYAAAATAAGVSLSALAPVAEAKIIYTPTHKVIGPNTVYRLDLNHDGINDFILSNNYRSSTGVRFASLLANGISANGFAASESGSLVFPLALRKGEKIGSSEQFRSQRGIMAGILSAVGGTFATRGQWVYAAHRYLGLKFSIQGKTHYGWARLTVFAVAEPPYVRSRITGYAYETIPNKAIIAGKTHGKDVVTLTEPASLGHLARGASAIPAWRAKQ